MDVKKLEFKIRKQRQKVAAEFRSLTPEQRHELVRESPYVSVNYIPLNDNYGSFNTSRISSRILNARFYGGGPQKLQKHNLK